MKNVWRLSAVSKDEKRHGKHPTQKAVGIIARSLRASTNPGDVVLDPFAGSSTTGLAAIGQGRCYIGCEDNQQYVSLSKKRLENLDEVKHLLH